MAASSIEQHVCARHVTLDTLYSLNLKIENNLNEYLILIVGVDPLTDLLEKMSIIVSEDCVKAFGDIESILSFIDSTHNTNIFLIISGTLGQLHVHKFVKEPRIISLYVYCMDENKHVTWTEGIKKIRSTTSNTEQLFIRLHADIKQLSGRWPFDEKSFQKASTITSDWYHLFLLVTSHWPQNIKKSYDDMLEECRAYYKKNFSTLKQIGQFEQLIAQMCKPENAIREYTRNSFLYRITNHALRTQNMEIIKKFSPFISDLHYQLHEQHRKYYHFSKIRAVYRGQYLSVDELEYISSVCKSRNPVIKLTTFGSASLDPEVALDFAPPLGDHIPCLFEIIITDEFNMEHDNRFVTTQTFANISSLSVMPNEQEVLFSLLSHFRVKYVGDTTVQPHRPWVPIVLELINNNDTSAAYNHLYIMERIENETNPQIYADIVYFLQANAADELKFNRTNWKKWWRKLFVKWGTYLASSQSLLLTFYDCVTEDKDWLRKAIEIHKDIHRSIPIIVSNSSSFSFLFKELKRSEDIPTQGIALYEEYLKQLCTTNTKEIIQCLYFAGQLYEKVLDKKCALECYQKALDMNLYDDDKMNDKIKNRIKQLNKPAKIIRPVNNEHTLTKNDIDKDFQRRYEAQEEQWSIFWYIRCRADGKVPKQKDLEALGKYLTKREQWCDASDLRTILRLPYGNNQDLSTNDYRFYCLSAIAEHMSSSALETDAANNRALSYWRYEKNMQEWILLKELERFLKLFQEESNYIRRVLLLQLDQLINKLSLLITACTAYICIKRKSGKINVNNIQFINMSMTNMKQLVFFDLREQDPLVGLETRERKIFTILPSFDSPLET